MRCENLDISTFIKQWLTSFWIPLHHILSIPMVCSDDQNTSSLFNCINYHRDYRHGCSTTEVSPPKALRASKLYPNDTIQLQGKAAPYKWHEMASWSPSMSHALLKCPQPLPRMRVALQMCGSTPPRSALASRLLQEREIGPQGALTTSMALHKWPRSSTKPSRLQHFPGPCKKRGRAL